MATLLVIEDEDVLYEAIERALVKLGHQVHWANRIALGEQRFSEIHPDLTLLDLRLPDGNGLDLLAKLRALDPSALIIIMTAYASVEDAVTAIKLGALDYLQKPLNLDDLRHAVSRAFEEARLKTEVSYFRGRQARGAGFEALVGDCAGIGALRAKIERLCLLPADAAPPTVLITGETGTGKGLVARVLHYNGPRATRPFLEVNCAALPEALIESELFGHEKGAFTDAKAAQIGLFQAADGGTLFLDEVSCLPLSAQVKLLKAIEEKTVRPVGGRSDRAVDVHIIAATNGDLEAMSQAGTFREDLFYRLGVVMLQAPPLRERGADILVLAHRVVAELCERYRQRPKQLSAEAQEALQRYGWPGNIRELRNTLDRAVLFTPGETIEPEALGLPHRPAGWLRWRLASDGAVQVELPEGGIEFAALERALIAAALAQTSGRLIDAAQLLGMSRDTLRYRIEKFGIEVPRGRDD
jgi:DNA-binding NtrC family response regulator